MPANTGPFLYSQEPPLVYTPKLAAARLAIVNTWATACSHSDFIASCVDDWVRALQAAGRWDDFENIWIAAGGPLSNVVVNLKGSVAMTLGSGYVATDNTLAGGIGDLDPNAVNKFGQFNMVQTAQHDLAFFLTAGQASNADIFNYNGNDAPGGGAAGNTRRISMGGGNGSFFEDTKQSGIVIRAEQKAGSGWKRFSNNGGATYTTWNDLSVEGNLGPFAGVNPTLTHPAAFNATAYWGSCKWRVLCWNNNTTQYSGANDIAKRDFNQVWAIETQKLDSKLRNKATNGKLAIIGDSLTSGANVNSKDSWVPRVEQLTGIRTINAGRSGNTLNDQQTTRAQPGALYAYTQWVKPLVQANVVSYVAWAIGINDLNFRSNFPGNALAATSDQELKEYTTRELIKCIQAAVADGIPLSAQTVVGTAANTAPGSPGLGGGPGGAGSTLTPSRNAVDLGLEEAASIMGVRYVPQKRMASIQSQATIDSWYVGSDNIHPNATGHLILAQNFINGDPATPTISAANKTSASVGETVRLTGTNFTGTTAVFYGGVPVSSFTVINATTIDVVIPSGPVGAQSFQVVSGTTAAVGQSTITVNGLPSLLAKRASRQPAYAGVNGGFGSGGFGSSILLGTVSPFVPLVFGGNLLAAGDSFTQGDGASVSTNRMADKLAGSFPLPVALRALGGSQIGHIAKLIMNGNDTINTNSISQLGNLFYNDTRFIGTNEAQRKAAYHCALAMAYHLAIPNSAKVFGPALIKSSGWTNAVPYPSTSYIGTKGATAQATVSGTVVYIHTLQAQTFGSYISVTVDGVDRGTYGALSAIVPNQDSDPWAPAIIRIDGLAPGPHVVVCTVGDPLAGATGGSNVFISWIAGNAAPGPTVLLATAAEMLASQASINAPFDKRTIPVWQDSIQAVIDIASFLRFDGLNAVLVRWDSVLSLPADLSADNVHPNDTGHLKLAQASYGATRVTPSASPYPDVIQQGRILMPRLSPPSYASYTPASPQVGDTVTLTGANFTVATVPPWTGGNIPTFSVINATTIRFTAPAVGNYSVGGLPITIAPSTNVSVTGLTTRTLGSTRTDGPYSLSQNFKVNSPGGETIKAVQFWKEPGSNLAIININIWSTADVKLHGGTIDTTGQSGIITYTIPGGLALTQNTVIKVARDFPSGALWRDPTGSNPQTSTVPSRVDVTAQPSSFGSGIDSAVDAGGAGNVLIDIVI
jgi:lysophospholipase L1-like esterase